MRTNNSQYAWKAGSALLIMALAAGFSYGYVHQSLVVEHDPQATFENIRSSVMLMQAGIGGWVIIFLCDLIVSWALYHYFRKVEPKISMVSSGLRLVYTAVLGVAIIHLFLILPLVTDSSPANSELLVIAHLLSFKRIWSAGLIIFGLHLLALAYLVFRAENIPQWLGWLISMAGISYFVIHLGKFFMLVDDTLIEQVERVLSLPMAIGELGFAFWLLIRRKKPYPVGASPTKTLSQV